MSTSQTIDSTRNPSVVIIGAGMTGMLMLIKLREAGVSDITVLEKKGKVGGTWRENTYPGVACDVPAHMYTYSFELNPEWSKRYAHGAEIQTYFEHVANKYDLDKSIRFNEAVTDLSYDQGKWTIKTSTDQSLTADFVVSATGILHHPAYPDIKGAESFKGDSFHTAEWDHSVALKGKRVGIIGTGSTACQVIPELVETGAEVEVFQRTPQWIVNMPNVDYSDKDKANWRSNPMRMQRLRKFYATCIEQLFSKAVIGKKIPHLIATILCKLNLILSVKDKELRAKLTPDYKVGCKRLVGNSKFYKAIQQSNASLITEGIEAIEAGGIRTKDGELHELDVLVYSTGFKPFNFMRPMTMTGKNGISIEQRWSQGVKAYRSLSIPDFPNFFLMLGPNTPIGNYSVIAMSEIQCAYVLKMIDKWRARQFDELVATDDALNQFNDYLQAGMGKTAWVGGCQSWYMDDNGNLAMWPYSWQQWVSEMAEPCMADFSTQLFADDCTDTKAA